MTVYYTTLLALGQPVTGTESGTWGDDVNNSVTSYLDIAIAGTLALTSANFTAGALTLANTQGSSSDTNISNTTAQYAVIRTSGLAQNSTITAPSSSRIYLIDNADATYTLTIKAAGQSGYTVPVSTKAWVYYNGTDYVLTTGNVTVTGTQTLTNKTITGTKETRVAVSASAIDLSLGNYFTKTISGTTTFSVSNVPSTGTAQAFVLELTNGGSATVNWWSGVKWQEGIAPTLTAVGVDILGFYTFDGGTTWRGFVLALNSK